MQYSKYENFSTNSAASETNNAMKKLDDAGKTDDGRKEEFKIIGGMDMDIDNDDNNRYGPPPRYDLSDFEHMINEYDNRINSSTTSQELLRIINELKPHLELYKTSLYESNHNINRVPNHHIRNMIYNAIIDINNKINKLNELINKANVKINQLNISNRGTKRPYSSIGGKRKKNSKSKKKRKIKRNTKKYNNVNYTYTLYMLPNKEIIEIIEYDDKNKKGIKNNFNNVYDMKEYYTTLKKINNIPCNKSEVHPIKLTKK